MALSPVVANAQISALLRYSPDGLWQSNDGDSRYDLSLCGDGTQLCAKLVWINPDKVNSRNVQYLDEYVVYQVKRVTPAEWRGQINIYGVKFGGSVKILSGTLLKVTGCAFAFFCESYTLEKMNAHSTS